jgi:hypothetical protein
MKPFLSVSVIAFPSHSRGYVAQPNAPGDLAIFCIDSRFQGQSYSSNMRQNPRPPGRESQLTDGNQNRQWDPYLLLMPGPGPMPMIPFSSPCLLVRLRNGSWP